MKRAWLVVVLVLVPVPSARAGGFPYDVDGKQAAVYGASGAAWGLGALLQGNVTPLTPAEVGALDATTVGSFDRLATQRWSPRASLASDVLVTSLMLSPLLLLADDTGAKEPLTLGNVYAQTMLLEQGVVFALKQLTARSRPFVYNPAAPEDVKLTRNARRSFPSGHAANAFAAATFTATVFAKLNPDSGARAWVWGTSLSAAAATAALRVQAGRHYPTDVLAGSALGAAIGLLVPDLYDIDEDGATGPARMQLVWGFGF